MQTALYQRIGRRIKRARETLLLSQEELARRLGYSSPATISFYESGERKISIADLQRVANVLGVPFQHLVEDEPPPDAQIMHFRAQEVRPTARRTLAAFLAFARKNGSATSTTLQGADELRPGAAAERVLAIADISEAPVLPHLVASRLGVPVYDWDFPDEISGVYARVEGVSCIGVNEHHPHVRQQFSVAHELGHHIYSGASDLFVDFTAADTLGRIEDVRQRGVETKANQFAADLLMPRDWVRADVRRHGIDVPLLAKRYHVSEQAIWFRLLNLRLARPEDPVPES